MNFKKIMAILLLSLSMCVAFTACSKTEGKSAKESSSDDDEDEEDEEEEESSSKKKKNKKKKNDDEDDKTDKKEKESSDIVYESEPQVMESEYEGNYILSYKVVLHDDDKECEIHILEQTEQRNHYDWNSCRIPYSY